MQITDNHNQEIEHRNFLVRLSTEDTCTDFEAKGVVRAFGRDIIYLNSSVQCLALQSPMSASLCKMHLAHLRVTQS